MKTDFEHRLARHLGELRWLYTASIIWSKHRYKIL